MPLVRRSEALVEMLGGCLGLRRVSFALSDIQPVGGWFARCDSTASPSRKQPTPQYSLIDPGSSPRRTVRPAAGAFDGVPYAAVLQGSRRAPFAALRTKSEF